MSETNGHNPPESPKTLACGCELKKDAIMSFGLPLTLQLPNGVPGELRLHQCSDCKQLLGFGLFPVEQPTIVVP